MFDGKSHEQNAPFLLFSVGNKLKVKAGEPMIRLLFSDFRRRHTATWPHGHRAAAQSHRAAEPQSDSTAEPQSDSAAARQNHKTARQQNSKDAEKRAR
jgi:hypothetical protein